MAKNFDWSIIASIPQVNKDIYLRRDDVEHLYEYALVSDVIANVGTGSITTVKKRAWPLPGNLRKILPLCLQGYRTWL